MKLSKKIISCLLALTVLVSVVPATFVNAADEEGMYATYYMPKGNEKGFWDIIVEEGGRTPQCSYDNMKKFDSTIGTLLANCFLADTEYGATDVALTKIGYHTGLGDDGWENVYIVKWSGTMTAKTSGTYTLVGHAIDNGFVMFVDADKVYEYWGASHWFDGPDDWLRSDEGSFTVEAGKSYNVEMYFLELDGGDNLNMYATTDEGNGSDMNDVFDFKLKAETYCFADWGYSRTLANKISQPLGNGDKSDGKEDGGNSGQCIPENQNFEKSIDTLLSAFVPQERTVVKNFNKKANDEDLIVNFDDQSYVIKYEGVLIPKVSGSYNFGADNVDNGFYLNINGTIAYEFWAGETWCDGGNRNQYGSSITLEAGKEYPFVAYFMEADGAQALDIDVSIDNADRIWVNDAFTFKPKTTIENTGASIRLVDPYGVRFKATYDETTGAIPADATDVQYGMLIIPEDMLNGAALTKDTVDVLDIEAKNFCNNNAPGTGTVEFTGVVTNVPEAAFETKLVARSYVTYTDANGAAVTLYAARTDVESYVSVAMKAYHDDDVTATIRATLDEIFA